MNKGSVYFVIHKDCFLVHGHAQSLICDTGNSRTRSIPNSLYELLIEAKKSEITYENLLSSSNVPNVVDSFCNQLVVEGYAFFSPVVIRDIHEFSFKHLPWYLIVEINSPTVQFIDNAIFLCRMLTPLFLQIRFTSFQGFDFQNEILKLFDQCALERLQILIPYSQRSHNPTLIDEQFNQIEQLEIITYYNFSIGNEKYLSKTGNVEYLSSHYEAIDSDLISMDTMICNYYSVKISEKRNLGQFQKLKLHSKGYLTNVGFESKQLLLSSKTTKQDILDSEIAGFWNITKDQIDVCECCQYKRICHDTSEITYQNNKYYRKNECNFNPFKNIWGL